MTTYTVTGAGGFIGKHLVISLRDQFPEAKVVGVVRTRPLDPVPGVEYEPTVESADTVYHLAGSSSVADSITNPSDDLANNAGTTLDLLDGLDASSTVVLASSCAVYGRVEGPASEEMPPRPIAPYGVSKLAAEEYVRAAHRRIGLDGRIARIGNAYGEGSRRLVISDLVSRALEHGAPLIVRGKGTEVRDFIHVSDVARGLVLIGTLGEPGAIYNIGSGDPRPLRDVAHLIATAVGLDEHDVEFDDVEEAGKVRVFYPSVDRLRSLGFRPQISLAAGIKNTVEWMRSLR